MTLDKVQCKVNEAFAPGQTYVALSRVRNLMGLYLDGAFAHHVCSKGSKNHSIDLLFRLSK